MKGYKRKSSPGTEVLTKSHSELMKLQADLAAIKSGTERQENAQEQERTLAEQLQKDL